MNVEFTATQKFTTTSTNSGTHTSTISYALQQLIPGLTAQTVTANATAGMITVKVWLCTAHDLLASSPTSVHACSKFHVALCCPCTILPGACDHHNKVYLRLHDHSAKHRCHYNARRAERGRKQPPSGVRPLVSCASPPPPQLIYTALLLPCQPNVLVPARSAHHACAAQMHTAHTGTRMPDHSLLTHISIACMRTVCRYPLSPPLVLPQADATCSSNPDCAKLGLVTGNCCPDPSGVYKSCCSFCSAKAACAEYAVTNTTMCCPAQTNVRERPCALLP